MPSARRLIRHLRGVIPGALVCLAFTPAGALAAGPDLKVAIAASPEPVRFHDTVTYTITVTNQGDAATQVWLLDDLDEKVYFMDATGEGRGECFVPYPGTLGGRISCRSNSPLGPGLSRTLTVTASAEHNGPAVNSTSVKIGDGTTSPPPDADPSNDDAQVTSTIIDAPPDGDGGRGGGGGGGGGSGEVALKLSGLAASPAAFHAAPRGATVSRQTGTAISYRLSKAAPMTFWVERATLGRRVGARCVAGRPAPGKPRCVRFVLLSAHFKGPGAAGSNHLHFSGRLAGRALAPGAYRLRAVARGVEENSSTARIGFRILR
jgi:uncharacterized repeat protein (TIGR01451 family)